MHTFSRCTNFFFLGLELKGVELFDIPWCLAYNFGSNPYRNLSTSKPTHQHERTEICMFTCRVTHAMINSTECMKCLVLSCTCTDIKSIWRPKIRWEGARKWYSKYNSLIWEVASLTLSHECSTLRFQASLRVISLNDITKISSRQT